MNTTINSAAKTIRKGHTTWTFAETGAARYFARVCAEHGDDVVSRVLSAGDYYPPLMDPMERHEVEYECLRVKLSPILD